MPQTINPIRKAVYLTFGMVLIASTAAAATKFASGYASVAAIITVQFLICLMICLPRILRVGIDGLKTQRPFLHLIRGGVGVLGFYLFYACLNQIPMVDAMLLRQSAPLTVPLVMWAWGGDQVSRSVWWPLIIGFVGILVILRPSPEGLSIWHLAGLVSAFTLSLSMVATRKLAPTEPPSRILFYYFVLSLLCVAPFSIGDYAALPWQAWLAMIYVGISIYFAMVLYNRVYSMAPASAVAPVNYFAVVFTGFWGWLLWDQVPDAWTLAGSVLVIAGGLMTIQLSRTEKA